MGPKGRAGSKTKSLAIRELMFIVVSSRHIVLLQEKSWARFQG